MSNWKMLTLVGEDRPGIVAGVTDALFRGGWNLGEASMIRLGGNFSVMMMVRGTGDVTEALRPAAQSMGLHMHVDEISGDLHQHMVPNIQVRVSGADRAGIVAQVTGALAEAGFNILELESDVAGSRERPVYIMNIQGVTETTLERVEQALDALGDVDVSVSSIETLIG
ncbi:MAG: amino acid-binding protein [Candidatus Sedimenticola endophacoides]|uniref:Amino acid-binding protein n=1 Tax=Candidatus Sedimenticola endophacoides TaxID=2548426 RepID=A0A657PM46_9GAMM|nr:MAG: amino acid-binding protein [Candidatus Sedimenticola endophacoides]OQX33163.1 MAG: amino acid-binding protein [Candidatus Sedimenticola endophacoides]OQX35573.1 MAG: amino acid-binding protein [Candidatus Sedimenticola endophacoides]OQX38984.1 MAG: amino acid-binding protein [Candidatus Sedimenticola endophacoides]OQX39863.1 MAG: amino acid-binding protein [Candidatus Sedimenticola endophacoides]